MKYFRIVFCAVALAATTAALGQTKEGDVIVDVPFTFMVANHQFPAGHYMITSGTDLIRIFNRHTEGLYVPTHSATRRTSDGSKLVFHHYGDTYFLCEVWVTGTTTGKALFPSRAEKEAGAHKAEVELAVVRPEK